MQLEHGLRLSTNKRSIIKFLAFFCVCKIYQAVFIENNYQNQKKKKNVKITEKVLIKK